MSGIRHIGGGAYAAHLDDGRVFTLSNRGGDDLAQQLWRYSGASWDTLPMCIAGERIVPYGSDNLLPTRLRDTLDANNLAPGVLDRQTGLIFGQGLQLYRLEYRDGGISRYWDDDAEIRRWLEDWDAEGFAKAALNDYLHLKGFFNSYHLARGSRIGRTPKIARLEHIPAHTARLEWTDDRRVESVRHILVGNFANACLDTGIRSYPVFDRRNPARHRVSAAYNRTYSFGRDFYSMPQFWGTLRWIVRGSEIPSIFKYVTDNGLNLAYHIHSPEAYWNRKREELRRIHPEWAGDDARVEKEIGKLTERFLTNLTEVLSGKENAGKFFHTVDIPDDTGKTVSWEISPIDQKIKDFVDSQLQIAEASSSAITSGMGLHPALSNLIINGKLASGSELLYAYKLFLSSDTEMPESAVLGPVNTAIAFNFPSSPFRVGFFHRTVHTEEATSTSDRMKNQ